jgi:hypothetical protein
MKTSGFTGEDPMVLMKNGQFEDEEKSEPSASFTGEDPMALMKNGEFEEDHDEGEHHEGEHYEGKAIITRNLTNIRRSIRRRRS